MKRFFLPICVAAILTACSSNEPSSNDNTAAPERPAQGITVTKRPAATDSTAAATENSQNNH